MTYVGNHDDIVNKRATSEEMAEYAGDYLEKIQNSKRKDKTVRVNPNTSTGTKAEIGTNKKRSLSGSRT
jgi:hypothetical protein